MRKQIVLLLVLSWVCGSMVVVDDLLGSLCQNSILNIKQGSIVYGLVISLHSVYLTLIVSHCLSRPQKEREDTKSEPAKGAKGKSSSRRKSSARRSKAKARKSSFNSAGGAKRGKPDIVDEPMNDLSVKADKSKSDDENSAEDQMDVATQNAETDSEKTSKQTPTKVGGESAGGESAGGESGGEGKDNQGEMSKEAKKEGSSNEVETD